MDSDCSLQLPKSLLFYIPSKIWFPVACLNHLHLTHQSVIHSASLTLVCFISNPSRLPAFRTIVLGEYLFHNFVSNKISFILFFILIWEWEGDRQKEPAPICWINPQMATIAPKGSEPGTRNLIQVLHMNGRNPITWAIMAISMY